MPTAFPPRRTHRALTTAAVLSGAFVSAIEMTIVGTAMPRIAGALGGSELLTWVVSIYLLTSTVAAPLFGKLADLYGRKPAYQASMALFLVGSTLSGAAPTMAWLIVARALQGIGGGGLNTVANTVVGDLYTPAERGKVQGLFSAVWGFAGAVGPLAGGLIVDHLNWRWIFLLNLPFGALAMVLLHLALHEQLERRRSSLDLLGAALLTASVTALQLAGGGHGIHGVGGHPAFLLALGAALAALFALAERRATAPLLPLALVRRPGIGTALLATLLAGGVQFGVLIFVPLYVQGVNGASAGAAGAVMTPFAVAWPVTGVLAGFAIARVDLRLLVRAGITLVALGGSLLLFARPDANPELFPLAGGIIGTGMGLSSTPLLVSLQSAVDWNERGVVTAAFAFCRTMGGTLGVVAAGLVQSQRLAARGVASATVDAMLRPGAPAAEASVRAALAFALDGAFVAVAVMGAVTWVAALAFPHVTMRTTVVAAPLE